MRVDDVPIHKDISEMRRGHREFDIRVKDVRRALDTMKLYRHVRIAKLLKQPETVVDGNRRVLEAVQKHRWRKSCSEVRRRRSRAAFFGRRAGG